MKLRAPIERIVIIHYHLLPGGVTSVIADSVKAILSHLRPAPRICLVSGRGDGVPELVQRLNAESDALVHPAVSFRIVPAFDYNDACGDADYEAAYRELLSLADVPGTLIWIHNYHLGKNPALTRAVVRISRSKPALPLLLHIHDFPESARYENLLRLRRAPVDGLYPDAAAVRFAVINRRDYDLLGEAGVTAKRRHLLWNPVFAAEREAAGGTVDHGRAPARARRRLSEAMGGTVFSPEKRLYLYPVRAIRRKNVLEAGLIVKLIDNAALIVTLPGVSRSERRYSGNVEKAFAAGVIPGVFAAGANIQNHGLALADLVDASDSIISTSVQEGFGYQFIHPLAWRKPLVARHLDVIDGLGSLFEGTPSLFYESVRVPFDLIREPQARMVLGRAYRSRATRIAELLGTELSEETRSALETDIEDLIARDDVDFSYLPVDWQAGVLESVSSGPPREAIRALNAGLLDAIERYSAIEPASMDRKIEAVFGRRAFAHRFAEVLKSFDAPEPATRPEGADSEGDGISRFLVNRFARLEHLRLLYMPLPEE